MYSMCVEFILDCQEMIVQNTKNDRIFLKVQLCTKEELFIYKASPLPPAPLVTSGLLICRLKGLAGIEELISRIEING